MKPIILATTIADMPKLLTAGKQVLGHSISRNIDATNIQKPIHKFLSALSEISNENADASKLFQLGLLADHCSYTLGLLISDNVYADFILFRQLNILSQDTIKRGYKFVVATSTLRGWRDSVIDGSTPIIPADTRNLFNDIYSLLCDEGLSKIWSDYTKTRHSDGTLILIEK